MEKRTQNQRKSFKRQLKNKLTETANLASFRPTTAVAVYWFRRLNYLLFNGKLGRVHIEVKKLHHDLSLIHI